MTRNRKARSFGSKTARVLLAGCVASAFMPAAAFALDGYPDLATVANTGTGSSPAYALQWPDGSWVQSEAEAQGGIYKWKTYIRGDNAHYGHYDALVTFKVENKTLKAIDLTSEGTTVGGKWGTLTPHSGNNMLGFLPEGVTSTTDLGSYGTDQTIKTIGLAGAGAGPTVTGSGRNAKSTYGEDALGGYGGYSIASISLRQVDSEGKVATKQVVDPSDGDIETVAVGYSVSDVTKDQDDDTLTWSAEDKSLTVKDTETGYNVLCIVYKIGDYYQFETRHALTDEEGVSTYVNEATDISQEPTGIGAKDRDVYSAAAYNLIVRKELASWLAYTDGSDELADIDTVSAATKSSQSIIEALYASQGISYPWSNNDSPTATVNSSWSQLYTSVADDVEVTIDGKTLSDDATKAEKNSSGQYVLTNKLFGDDVAVAGFDLYTLDSSLSNAGMWRLSKGSSKGDASATYMTNYTNSTGHGLVGAYGVKPEAIQGRPVSEGANPYGDKEKVPLEDVVDDETMSYNPDTKALTIKDPNVTHVVVQYAVGKFSDANGGTCGVSYELDPAHTAEVKKAKDEAAEAEKKAQEEAAAEANLVNATLSLSKTKYTYTGKAQTPSVTVKSKSGKVLVKDKDYTVSYSGNTNVGTARATVSGKGAYNGSKTATFAIGKATPTVKAKAASYKVAYGKKYKKKKTTKKLVGKTKVAFTSTLGGKASITAVAKKGKVSIAKNGKITVAKGCKAGTYKVPVKVKVAGTGNLNTVTKTITVKVKVAKK